MISLFRRTSPFAQFSRWLVATIANIAHADHGFLVLYSTPVPANVSDRLNRISVHTWGDIYDVLHISLPSGATQLTLAILTHVITATMVLWWAIESYHQLQEAKHWLRGARVKVALRLAEWKRRRAGGDESQLG